MAPSAVFAGDGDAHVVVIPVREICPDGSRVRVAGARGRLPRAPGKG
jgi:hypothetical protein